MAEGFESMERIAAEMGAFPAEWFICGGWAIDLFLGCVTRKHADVEVGIYREDLKTLRGHFWGRRFEKVVNKEWTEWLGERPHLPLHQVRAFEASGNTPALEFLVHERQEDLWQFRRHPELTRPLKEVWMQSFLGIPILVPEVQLLFKAKETRQKDQQDFGSVPPRLSTARRAWLQETLRRFYRDHPWIKSLANSSADLSL